MLNNHHLTKKLQEHEQIELIRFQFPMTFETKHGRPCGAKSPRGTNANPSPRANEISPSCYENIRQKRCAYPMRTRFHRHGGTRCSRRSRTLTEGHRGILYHPAWISGGSQWRFSVMDCRRHDSAFRGGRRSNKARPLLIVSALEAVIQRSISLQRGFRAFGKSN